MTPRYARASLRIGSWLAAALDDPAVCQAMRDDIREWMEAMAEDEVSYVRGVLDDETSEQSARESDTLTNN